MEKVKSFITSPKKTAILALICISIICGIKLPQIVEQRQMDIYDVMIISSDIYILGLMYYFFIVIMRMYGRKCNLNIANYVLITSWIITVILNIAMFGMPLISIYFPLGILWINCIIDIFIIIYLYNILLRKTNLISNKIFVIAVLLYVVLLTITCNMWNRGGIVVLLTSMPYFYNYYNFLKRSKGNGK